MINSNKNLKLAIIGLGYVGLPLAIEFGKKRSIVGFDIEKKRIEELNSGYDRNLETKSKDLKNIKNITFTCSKEDLKSANCFIITVPTPINNLKKPDLKPLYKASKIVGNFLKKKDIVIYESTVYPGCIEDECVPVLQKFSGLKFNKDFFCGYSPERINPGDKKYTVSNIKKITSGSNQKIAKTVDDLYNEIVSVGTHKAPSIKVAEAAKVIENTQRDLNIALINELSIFFQKINLDTNAVLEAAGSKWNFLPFKPGLVGGHCIGVDPYYLTFKANQIGYKPKIILAGRNLNDKMGNYVASQMISAMKKKSIKIKGSKILVMGLTFKENCADFRNSGVKNVIDSLKKMNCKIDLYDPWANKKDIRKIYKIAPKSNLIKKNYDGIILAVAHDKFKTMGFKKIYNLCKKKHVIYDLKYLFTSNKIDIRL
tara:strand:- start:2879 stop:4159 length:1281 start_codon:yes stop_codon:yes gene_type:complete